MDLSGLFKLLSENVAALSENVGWLGPTGWTKWLEVEVSVDGPGVEQELVDLASWS